MDQDKDQGKAKQEQAKQEEARQEQAKGQANDQKVLKRIRDWTIIYSLPFWYGTVTRLPFIYYVIHMRLWFEMEWLSIGFFVAAYQSTRVIVNVITLFLPPVISHTAGTLIAVAGNCLVYISSNDEKLPFLIGTIIVGFAEHLAAMQTYLKKNFTSDLGVLEQMLKVQYAMVAVASTFAFGVGGALYQFYGIDGVALLGATCASLEVISICIYYILDRCVIIPEQKEEGPLFADKKRQWRAASFVPKPFVFSTGPSSRELTKHDESENYDHSENNEWGYEKAVPEVAKNTRLVEGGKKDKKKARSAGLRKVSLKKDLKLRTSQVGRFRAGILDDEILAAMSDYFSGSGMGATYVNYILCFTFGVESITIGYNLAISPVFILQQFGKQPSVIGAMLSAGAAAGSIASILFTLSGWGKKLMRKYMPSPYNLLFTMAGIGVSVWMAAVPVFYIHVAGLLLLMAFNDVAALLLNEMQGAMASMEAYRSLAPMGQTVRRTFNVVTAITGPILFSVFPSLPYLIAGAVTLAWTIFLGILIRHRMDENSEIIQKNREDGKAPERKTSFIRSEIMARVASRLVLTPRGSSYYGKPMATDGRISATQKTVIHEEREYDELEDGKQPSYHRLRGFTMEDAASIVSDEFFEFSETDHDLEDPNDNFDDLDDDVDEDDVVVADTGEETVHA